MPKTELHKEKKQKNYTVLALIAFWVTLIWLITMVKMHTGQ
ncbi:MAG: hypothetical protein AAF988_07955 [Pseudomonadota bacterium]